MKESELTQEQVDAIVGKSLDPKYGWALGPTGTALSLLHQAERGQPESTWVYKSDLWLFHCGCGLGVWAVPLLYSIVGAHRN